MADDFFRSLNHELRGPLMSLSNCVEILKRANLDSETLEAVAEIERQVGLLGKAVDNRLLPVTTDAGRTQ
jgi:signal transduction histidine kinase